MLTIMERLQHTVSRGHLQRPPSPLTHSLQLRNTKYNMRHHRTGSRNTKHKLLTICNTTNYQAHSPSEVIVIIIISIIIIIVIIQCYIFV